VNSARSIGLDCFLVRVSVWPIAAVAMGSKRPRLCENACAALKSALLGKICERLVNQETENLRRSAIFVPVLTENPAPKRFHAAWTHSSLWGAEISGAIQIPKIVVSRTSGQASAPDLLSRSTRGQSYTSCDVLKNGKITV
jgi:hypothetical protein